MAHSLRIARIRGTRETQERAAIFHGSENATGAIATLVGMLGNFVGLNPIRALVLSAIINGVTSPPLLLLIVLLANRRAVMGRFVNDL